MAEPQAPSTIIRKQINTSITLSPKTVDRVKAAMDANTEESFSRAVDKILTEAYVLQTPFYAEVK